MTDLYQGLTASQYQAISQGLERLLRKQLDEERARGVRCEDTITADNEAANANNWLYDSAVVRRIFKGGHTRQPDCPVCAEANA